MPHVTLLGQLTADVDWIKSKMMAFYKDATSFYLSFSHTGMFDTYFRSIVLHTHPNPDLEKMQASAKIHFQVEMRDAFMPHLSLLYSNLQISQKKILMHGIALESPLSVRIEAAVLVDTNGAPNQWQEILRIPFN